MKINIDEVKHVARLAKLRFTEEETEKMAEEFNAILEHFQLMNEVELGQVDALKGLEGSFSLRKDEAQTFTHQKKLFRNVKKTRDGYIEVPKIIE